MRFAYGATRIVWLVGPYAIKVPRPRPIRPFVRLIQLLRNKQVGAQLRTYDENRALGALKYLLAGLRANRREFRISQGGLCSKYRLAPVIKQMAWGLIIVQERGLPLDSKTDLSDHPLWLEMVAEAKGEDPARKQFALFGTRPLLVDYANPELSVFDQAAGSR